MFGRSIRIWASTGFRTILTRKAESAGGQVLESPPPPNDDLIPKGPLGAKAHEAAYGPPRRATAGW